MSNPCKVDGLDADAHATIRTDHAYQPEPDTGPDGAAILEAVRAADVGLYAYVEQTGGGCATVYVGFDPDIFNADARAFLSIGPGTYDWSNPGRSRFYWDELSIGADDDGETPSTYVETLDDITRAVAERLAAR